MITWIRSQDTNEKKFWLGLLLLFVGVAASFSVATAVLVVGAVMTVESVLTSYLAAWMGER